MPQDFIVHSCHCYFLLAGSSELPILFHVEKVRDGKSYATRTVQARQKGRAIFTATMSFVREGSSGSPSSQVSHASPMPLGADGKPVAPPPDNLAEIPDLANMGPFQSNRIEVINEASPHAHEKKTRQWVRAKGEITGGHQAHLNALAYVSDSFFIGTITRIHKLWRFPFKAEDVDKLEPELRERVTKLNAWEGMGDPKDMVGRPEML